MIKKNWNSKENLWHPSAGDNRIRIAPAVTSSDTSAWWMRVDVHNVPSGIGSKKFVCNSQLFKKPCSLCELRKEFEAEGEVEEAKSLSPWRYTFLNVIDRAKENGRIKVWMAPISAWQQIGKAVSNNGGASLIMDVPKNGTYGHDLSVYYSPNGQQYGRRYKVSILNGEPRKIGTEEQIEQWVEQLLPLKPENFYDVVDRAETMRIESSIRSQVKGRQAWCKRRPLFVIIHGHGSYEEVREAKRIVRALEGWTAEEIFKEEQREYQILLAVHKPYDDSNGHWALRLDGQTEWMKKYLIENNDRDREEIIKAYKEEKRKELEVIVEDPEKVYEKWLEERKDWRVSPLLKLRYWEDWDRYHYYYYRIQESSC